MSDRSTKLILALLAAGIWANAAAMLLRPAPAQAQDAALASIANNINLIAMGTCTNGKLC